MSKEFLILFDEIHLQYSPTTLNLFFKLKEEGYNVKLITAKKPIPSDILVTPGIEYVDFEKKHTLYNTIKVLFYKIKDKIISYRNISHENTLYNFKTLNIIAYLKKTNREIIAVDSLALWCAQQSGKKPHFLSLEIRDNDRYFKSINPDTLKSVIIQSTERLEHLFPQQRPRYFIVQNAPDSLDFIPPYKERVKTDLIYCGGSSFLQFGIITCLDFLKDYKEYTLTIKGSVLGEVSEVINLFYKDLLDEGRLIINTDFLSEKDLTHFISKFRIGFAFYDFYRFSNIRSFNYYTAPSGKVFQYLNSGVPIIGNSLPGFQFIEQGCAGKLIGHLSSKQIKLSIDAIEDDYLSYAQNAKSLSFGNDFKKGIQPFFDYINTEVNYIHDLFD